MMASRKLEFSNCATSINVKKPSSTKHTVQQYHESKQNLTHPINISEDEVYVGNFCYTYDKSKLMEIFENYPVKDVRMHVHQQKAYAFLKLPNKQVAQNMVREMKNTVVDGRRLLVKMASLPKKGNASCPPDLEDANEYEGLPALEPIPCETDYSGMPPLEPIDAYSNMPPLEPIEEYSNMPPLEPIEDLSYNGFTNKRSSPAHSIAAGASQKVPEPLGQVILANFPYGSAEADLMSIFNEFQPVMCRIYINAPTSRISKPTYAFVYVLNSHFAEAAAKALHLTNYRGCVITVKNISN